MGENNFRGIGIKKKRFSARHAWPTPTNRIKTSNTFKVFQENWENYCKTSTLAGYKHLAEADRSWFERAIGILVQATTACILGLLVTMAYWEYHEVSLMTAIESTNYPASHLQFPVNENENTLIGEYQSTLSGIAICNVNRISRKAAIEFASEIARANVTKWEFADILHLVRNFGALYASDGTPNVTSEKHLDEILLRYYNGNYDTRSIMKNLTPSCTEGLTSCRFRGKARNCSDIFEFRRTENGFCCTFNYAREPDNYKRLGNGTKYKMPKVHKVERIGQADGLSLVMEPFIDDYYYSILPTRGFKLMVFKSLEFPGDNVGDSVSEILLSPATETLIEMRVSSMYSMENIRQIAIEKRECLFRDEFRKMRGIFTEGDCRLECRATVIWNMCQCRQFFLPTRGGHHNKPYMTIAKSGAEDDQKYESEQDDTASKQPKICSHCFSNCADIRYTRRSYTYNLDKGVYNTNLLKNVTLENQSIAHIYFVNAGTIRRKQEVAYYWYDFISNMGGICGLFVGLSLISVAEFAYFLVCVLRDLLCYDDEAIAAKKVLLGTNSSARRNKIRYVNHKLYWNELSSHSRVTILDPTWSRRLRLKKSLSQENDFLIEKLYDNIEAAMYRRANKI